MIIYFLIGMLRPIDQNSLSTSNPTCLLSILVPTFQVILLNTGLTSPNILRSSEYWEQLLFVLLIDITIFFYLSVSQLVEMLNHYLIIFYTIELAYKCLLNIRRNLKFKEMLPTSWSFFRSL